MNIKTKPEPYCPKCGGRMILRRPRQGQNWTPFWGCSEYPECRGKRNIQENGTAEQEEGAWGETEI